MIHNSQHAFLDTAVCRHTAIVTEGGGQRGIFTAGVLDAFLRHEFNPFGMGVGSSAGAQNLLTYFIGLPGYAKRAIAELSHTPSFFVPYRWLARRSIIDLDTYFYRMLNDPGYQLPYHHITEISKSRRLLFVATRKSDLAATYLEPSAHTVVQHMKASSAVPFLYKPGVEIDNEILVDGSVSDPIPVIKAYEQGARRMVVIRTVPHHHETSSMRQRMDVLGLDRALPTEFVQMIEQHENAFEKALQFIRCPPTELEIIQIAPDKPLQSSLFGSRSSALLADYGNGLRAGESALEQLNQWRQRIETTAV